MKTAPRAALAATLLAAPALADFTTPDGYGWSRFDENSAYFAWDFFTATEGNAPDVGLFPDPLPSDWARPDVSETTGNGIVTGSGNIYSPFGAINIDVTIPNYGAGAGLTTVLVQVRTLGNELDYANVTLDGLPADETVELSRVDMGDTGFEVETLFLFERDGNADVYTARLPTTLPHVSIDAITVDTFTRDECRADFNGDGEVNTQDFIAFLNAWSAGDAEADYNGDGSVNTQDFISFLNLWSAGC